MDNTRTAISNKKLIGCAIYTGVSIVFSILTGVLHHFHIPYFDFLLLFATLFAVQTISQISFSWKKVKAGQRYMLIIMLFLISLVLGYVLRMFYYLIF